MRGEPRADQGKGVVILADFEQLARVLRGGGAPARVFNIELFVDEPVRAALAERLGIGGPADPEDPLAIARRDAALFEALGYDLVRVHLPGAEFPVEIPGRQAGGRRTAQGYLVHEHAGPIQTPEDMEAYPWPDIAGLDVRPLEWAERHLPGGMKAYDLAGQFFECACWLMGYESLFVALYEEPEFVEELLSRIARVYFDYTRLLCQFGCIGVIWGGGRHGFQDADHRGSGVAAPSHPAAAQGGGTHCA